ncbi:MAG: Panacea domain-containing protein [Candidatus Limnocylindrales bacterium]
MAKVDDVAAAVLARCGPIDTWKFQKLMYYCQAWHLVWESKPLFQDRIEAWANGPVVPNLYAQHRGQFVLSGWASGNAGNLTDDEISTIDAVLESYGGKTGHWLSSLSHLENPWREAREGLAQGERGQRVITHEAMAEYYGGLV